MGRVREREHDVVEREEGKIMDKRWREREGDDRWREREWVRLCDRGEKRGSEREGEWSERGSERTRE